MSRNGSGIYSAPTNSWNPAITATTISPTDWAAILTDLSTALSQSVAVDGQTPVTGNLQMNGFKHTGTGDASAAGQYVTYAQATNAYVAGSWGVGAVPTFTLDVQVASPSIRVNATTSTNNPSIVYARGGTSAAFVSNIGANDGIITGSLVGDYAARIVSGRMVVSTDNGASCNYIFDTGKLGLGTVPAVGIHIKGAGSGPRFRSESTGGAIAEFSAEASDAYVSVNTNHPLLFQTNASIRGGFEADGRFYGTGLHNNGTVTGTAKQYLASGTYTPTLTNVANIPSSVSAKATWIRVGNVVTVYGSLTTGTLSATGTTTLGISLPVASNLATANDLSGTFIFNINNLGAAQGLQGDGANDRAQMTWIAPGTTTCVICYSFQYEVL